MENGQLALIGNGTSDSARRHLIRMQSACRHFRPFDGGRRHIWSNGRNPGQSHVQVGGGQCAHAGEALKADVLACHFVSEHIRTGPCLQSVTQRSLALHRERTLFLARLLDLREFAGKHSKSEQDR